MLKAFPSISNWLNALIRNEYWTLSNVLSILIGSLNKLTFYFIDFSAFFISLILHTDFYYFFSSTYLGSHLLFLSSLLK